MSKLLAIDLGLTIGIVLVGLFLLFVLWKQKL